MSQIERGIPRGRENGGNVVIFTGVNGAGKSTLLRQAKRAGIIPQNVRGIELGNRLARRLRTTGVPLASKDGIRKLSPELVYSHITELVTEHIMEAESPTIIVSHLVYEQDGDFVSLLDHYSNYSNKICGVFPIFAQPNEIQLRRKRNKRGRNVGTYSEIALQQEAILTAAIELASRSQSEARLIMSTPLQARLNGPTLHHVDDAMKAFKLAV